MMLTNMAILVAVAIIIIIIIIIVEVEIIISMYTRQTRLDHIQSIHLLSHAIDERMTLS